MKDSEEFTNEYSDKSKNNKFEIPVCPDLENNIEPIDESIEEAKRLERMMKNPLVKKVLEINPKVKRKKFYE